MFQSPSLRGSGRFGSVIWLDDWLSNKFQSPSLRGSGRFKAEAKARREAERRFQSPSLRGSGRFMQAATRALDPVRCFNPLHCGAVVASLGHPHEEEREDRSFNPLHCGAVVASSMLCFVLPCHAPVSIPFIAGQWSLRKQSMDDEIFEILFQSPSLRGSGRFATPIKKKEK